MTGLPVRSASMQACTCMDRSSRAPNAPPTPARVIRTSSGGDAEGVGDLAPVHVQPLGGHEQVDPTVDGGHRQPGLGSQERLVLHADLVVAR